MDEQISLYTQTGQGTFWTRPVETFCRWIERGVIGWKLDKGGVLLPSPPLLSIVDKKLIVNDRKFNFNTEPRGRGGEEECSMQIVWSSLRTLCFERNLFSFKQDNLVFLFGFTFIKNDFFFFSIFLYVRKCIVH